MNIKEETEEAVAEALIVAFEEGAKQKMTKRAAKVISEFVIRELLSKGFFIMSSEQATGKSKGVIYEQRRQWYVFGKYKKIKVRSSGRRNKGKDY
jgi:hypothetical protein